MDLLSNTNTVKEEQFQIEETGDSCAAEYVSGEWSYAVKPDNFQFVKQEPDDVCFIVYFWCILLR